MELGKRKRDFLYHLGLDWVKDSANKRIKDFADIRFVLLGGKPSRMKAIAEQLVIDMKQELAPLGVQEVMEVSQAGRYAMYKVGPVITVSHGMGRPSLSILLEELGKLLFYAKDYDKEMQRQHVSFLRLGTCGGLGVAPGSLILSTEALMPDLTTGLVKYELNKKIVYPSHFSTKLSREIINFSTRNNHLPQVLKGKTITTDDFYLGQGRFDGYFKSDFTEDERLAFFGDAYQKGVRNFEMEASELAAFCNRPGTALKFEAATLCVSLLDRMQGDQVTSPHSDIISWEQGLLEFASLFVCDALLKS